MLLKRNTLIAILILLIVAFTLLSIFIAHHPILLFDIDISVFIQKYHSDFLDKVMLAISIFGEIPFSLVSVLVVAGIFYFKKYKREALYIALILFSGLIILGIKNMINRPRPTAFYVRLVEVNRFQSYPSGHVLSYVLFFGFLIILMNTLNNIPKATRLILTYISGFLIITIAISRIYLGAHWFTDTLGGFLLGLICLFPLCYFYFKNKKAYIANTVSDSNLEAL
ncbi:phosphatase PAP2 family protein [Pedobacter punctiformis]|uniref:Phosphatase PAP2 family protein n=1 Tax=Pedobacter punctiformis TaxID=3004097 RepID=A0ABT4L9S2_9SPHI|nr:phosphatase PAP2 family protein [Pedobacter sp. HCMS5-2]MCZ4243554.1 phosphatase PAP2 family protein [Pedobacter sp. HCMS5-2]